MATPSITALPQPIQGNVLIQVNWSATPAATYARVLRVEADGTKTAVRTNTSTDSTGEYMELSAGMGIWYDTEAPFDVALTYCTDAIDASGNPVIAGFPQLAYDGFEFGVAAWSPVGGTFAQSSTRAVAGLNSGLLTVVGTPSQTYVRNTVAVTQSLPVLMNMWLICIAGMTGQIGMSIDWYDSLGSYISTSSNGTSSNLPANLWTFFTFNATAPVNAVQAQWGFTIGSPTAGQQVLVDQAYLFANTTNTGATSTEIILASSGRLWLRDGIFPAGNLPIALTPPPSLPECIPGEGIFFLTMGDRNLGVQSTNWTVNNSSTPISLQQVRAAPTSSLNLALRSFGDYDALKALAAEGSTLLLSVPDKYGYEGGYVAVGDVTVARVSRKYQQQWQLASLPYATSSRPGGLSYGTLGTRWIDLCSVYPTFADATAAGITWQRILLGQASAAMTPVMLRSWATINSDFASWNALNSGGRTWQKALEGH